MFTPTAFHIRFVHLVLVLVMLGFFSACTSKSPSTIVTEAIEYPTSAPAFEPTEAEIPPAGQVCYDALQTALMAGKPSAPFLIMIKHPTEDKWVVKYHDRLPQYTSTDLTAIATLVCIEETVLKVGCYSSGGVNTQCSLIDPPAYKRSWNIRIVRWNDKQPIAETSLTGGEPPSSIPALAGAGYGNPPIDELREWLMEQMGQ